MEYKTSHDAHSISIDHAFNLFKRQKIIASPLPALVVLKKEKLIIRACVHILFGEVEVGVMIAVSN